MTSIITFVISVSVVTFVTPNFTFVKQSFALLKFVISFPNYFLFHIIMNGECASGIYVDTILYKERLYDYRKDDVVASSWPRSLGT